MWEALRDFSRVSGWIAKGELKNHIFFQMKVDGPVKGMIKGVLAALTEVVFVPKYVSLCATAHVGNIFWRGTNEHKKLAAAHTTYASSLFSRKGGEALCCDAGYRPWSISSALVRDGAPLTGTSYASKSFTPEYSTGV